MIQLQIVGGRKSGEVFAAKRMPVHIGRGAQDDLQLEDDGVWDGHAAIALTKEGFFHLTARQETMACVGGQRVTEAPIKEGDVIDLGGARIIFHLAPARQKSLVFREGFFWAALVLFGVGELILMFWLG